MARRPDLQRRQELLNAVVEEVAAGGIGDRSLRDVAEAVGTSHRMLLHHFGSRNELLLAIVEEVERRQMAVLRDLPAEPAEGVAAMWADVRRPELPPFERLFFECYARGAQGEQPFARMLPGAVDAWLADVDAASGGTAPTPPWCASVWPSSAVCCWTWWPPRTDAGVDAAAQAFVDLIRRQTGANAATRRPAGRSRPASSPTAPRLASTPSTDARGSSSR